MTREQLADFIVDALKAAIEQEHDRGSEVFFGADADTCQTEDGQVFVTLEGPEFCVSFPIDLLTRKCERCGGWAEALHVWQKETSGEEHVCAVCLSEG